MFLNIFLFIFLNVFFGAMFFTATVSTLGGEKRKKKPIFWAAWATPGPVYHCRTSGNRSTNLLHHSEVKVNHTNVRVPCNRPSCKSLPLDTFFMPLHSNCYSDITLGHKIQRISMTIQCWQMVTFSEACHVQERKLYTVYCHSVVNVHFIIGCTQQPICDFIIIECTADLATR